MARCMKRELDGMGCVKSERHTGRCMVREDPDNYKPSIAPNRRKPAPHLREKSPPDTLENTLAIIAEEAEGLVAATANLRKALAAARTKSASVLKALVESRRQVEELE